MGTDPARSVVDADCRTHDVPNLFVVDSSWFPLGRPQPDADDPANAFRVATTSPATERSWGMRGAAPS